MRRIKKQSRKISDLAKTDEFRAWLGCYLEPVKLRAGSFLDYLLDVHSFPDQVELRKVYNGQAGFEQDARNMHRYARNALSGIGK